MEKIATWRIWFCATASAMLFGKEIEHDLLPRLRSLRHDRCCALRAPPESRSPQPAPERFIATTPMIRPSVVTTSNRIKALIATRPTERSSLCPAMPVVIVANNSGATIMRIRRRNKIAGQSRLRGHMRSIKTKLHAGNHREKRPGHQRWLANREDEESTQYRSSEERSPATGRCAKRKSDARSNEQRARKRKHERDAILALRAGCSSRGHAWSIAPSDASASSLPQSRRCTSVPRPY